MQQRKIPVADYEWLAATFNPTKFDAKVWVALAQRAGARYITITSRHHDGFSMFKTKQTRYNIVDWTPFGRDPLKELADACRETGIKLFFYYSQLDWHHADYWPRGLQPAALIIPNHHETPRPGEDAQTLLVGGTRVPFRQTATGLALTLPPRGADEIDQVVVLDLAR